MSRTILTISEKGGFLFKAICNGLRESNYEVIDLDLQKDRMPDPAEIPDMVIVYLSPDLFVRTKCFQSLSEAYITSDVNKKIYLIGSPEEFIHAERLLSPEAVWAHFARPVNVQDVISQLEKDTSTSPGLKPQILLVDDDPVSMRVMEDWLSGSFRVTITNSGADALEYMSHNAVDLVLLDYEMPIMNGPAVLQAMRSNLATHSIPVMFLTAKDDMESVQNAISLKPERYILKSIPREALVRIIEDFFYEK